MCVYFIRMCCYSNDAAVGQRSTTPIFRPPPSSLPSIMRPGPHFSAQWSGEVGVVTMTQTRLKGFT